MTKVRAVLESGAPFDSADDCNLLLTLPLGGSELCSGEGIRRFRISPQFPPPALTGRLPQRGSEQAVKARWTAKFKTVFSSPVPKSFFLTLLTCLVVCGSNTVADEKAELKKPTPFVDRVVSYQIGSGGGQGEDKLPDIVLGPPKGGGKLKAGRDVFSLGKDGVITLEFVDNEVFDGKGPDLIVFENPFLAEPGNDPDFGFFELGKVEVSLDGITWHEFSYDTASKENCAGYRPVIANSEKNEISPTDVKKAGGDHFDLKQLGLKVIRFVRITDIQSFGGKDGSAGFDLDAIVAVNSRPRKK